MRIAYGRIETPPVINMYAKELKFGVPSPTILSAPGLPSLKLELPIPPSMTTNPLPTIPSQNLSTLSSLLAVPSGYIHGLTTKKKDFSGKLSTGQIGAIIATSIACVLFVVLLMYWRHNKHKHRRSVQVHVHS